MLLMLMLMLLLMLLTLMLLLLIPPRLCTPAAGEKVTYLPYIGLLQEMRMRKATLTLSALYLDVPRPLASRSFPLLFTLAISPSVLHPFSSPARPTIEPFSRPGCRRAIPRHRSS
jgi:hypothetical protein